MDTIKDGTRVAIKTTNGGAIVATLTHEYRPTYPVTLKTDYGHSFTVMPDRLESITPVS